MEFRILDPDAILRKLGGKRALFVELRDIFADEGPRYLAAIRAGLVEGNAAAVRLACHSLRGSLSYFGVDAAIQLAGEIERHAAANNLTALDEMCSRLAGLVDSALSELQLVA